MLRRRVQHTLPAVAGGRQAGGMKGGSTDALQLALALFLKQARSAGRSAAVLFTDIKAAFYSIFAEVSLGVLLPEETRTRLFEKAQMPEAARQAVLQLLEGGGEVTAPANEEARTWRRALQDWHVGCSFGIQNTTQRTLLWSGTRPGDALADLVSA